MKYFSTRDKSLEFSFKDIFLRGLAPDGGLFLPSEIKKYSEIELKNLSKMLIESNYVPPQMKKVIERDMLLLLDQL